MAVSDALTVLFRGGLSSCNYACPYCPFAKRKESRAELDVDRRTLARFVAWVGARAEPTAVFFTPWGEALVRTWYREAIAELSRMPTVARVAIQTNLHAPLRFLDQARPDKIGLWCTYHPGQVSRGRFLGQCERLEDYSVDYSVGVVGLRAHIDEIEALRTNLPPSRYLWVNAYKRDPSYYSVDELERLARIDPFFALNNQRHPSRGHACRTGHSVISVDAAGDARRCHFVPEVIGNIYDPRFARALRPRRCPNETCSCHIGYVHMERLGLYDVYGDGLLERIPTLGAASQLPSAPRHLPIVRA